MRAALLILALFWLFGGVSFAAAEGPPNAALPRHPCEVALGGSYHADFLGRYSSEMTLGKPVSHRYLNAKAWAFLNLSLRAGYAENWQAEFVKLPDDETAFRIMRSRGGLAFERRIPHAISVNPALDAEADELAVTGSYVVLDERPQSRLILFAVDDNTEAWRYALALEVPCVQMPKYFEHAQRASIAASVSHRAPNDICRFEILYFMAGQTLSPLPHKRPALRMNQRTFSGEGLL